MSYPKHSYFKYRPLYADRSGAVPHGLTQSLIESRRLFYATPTSFNDPFDCNLRLHTNDSTDDDWVSYIDALIAKCPSRRNQLTVVKAERLWSTHPEFSDIGLGTRRTIYEESSVLCLAKRPDSIPMFAYYADDHNGIAIELEFSDDEIPCGVPFGNLADPANIYERKIIMGDIEYLPTLPELNYHRLYGRPQLIKSLMFTKFDGWRHEEEFRVFRKGVAASTAEFPATMLKRVIFGARTGSAEIDLVKHWLSHHGYPVILAKVVAAVGRFGLDISDFETFTP
ncbi:MAG: DUF2971 domain-containing protein [Opitutales bacterium]|nr:DUF2971 domain-containing protein [Opitutales bacterium]